MFQTKLLTPNLPPIKSTSSIVSVSENSNSILPDAQSSKIADAFSHSLNLHQQILSALPSAIRRI